MQTYDIIVENTKQYNIWIEICKKYIVNTHCINDFKYNDKLILFRIIWNVFNTDKIIKHF